MEIIIFIIVGWIFSGIFAYGISMADSLATWKNTVPRDHLGISLFMACWGPAGLIMMIFLSNIVEHGMKFSLKENK